ncbi:hypothetical protein BDV96DRAFT_375210 [Lophiotrema nucula]|uniref:Uncharacterized protein n=1 Tax=Lophiotrema nucula TaxID=690887 RepID=A0A6A5YGD3_9PLEO|nr:hypothetical protein BDV96DRAFT_375210 [Lophiotrema nucula]
METSAREPEHSQSQHIAMDREEYSADLALLDVYKQTQDQPCIKSAYEDAWYVERHGTGSAYPYILRDRRQLGMSQLDTMSNSRANETFQGHHLSHLPTIFCEGRDEKGSHGGCIPIVAGPNVDNTYGASKESWLPNGAGPIQPNDAYQPRAGLEDTGDFNGSRQVATWVLKGSRTDASGQATYGSIHVV